MITVIDFPARATSTTAEQHDHAAVVAAFILPLVNIPIGITEKHYDMTKGQMNSAFRFLQRQPGDGFRRWNVLLRCRIDLIQALERVTYLERDLLLGAMWQRYPATAKRIIAGLRKA